ncbi:MAG: oligopeptide/dipeptide ABC transporter ATP-binding protein [Planctomycetota bacterium]|nr:oligopeptide/dipeptide ABC transporter ATP-binding protein [Planctomycetota bacterium]
MIAAEPLLSVRNLKKYFPVYSKGFFQRRVGYVKAVDDISFDLIPGETLGLVGESGCGKTTTGRTILRALEPTGGKVLFRTDGQTVNLAEIPNRRLKALRPKMQMIFQDPFSSLNPRMTIGRIIGEPLEIHGMAKGRELKDRVAEMLIKVGLKAEHAVRYPHAFSGGQRQRAGIARSLIMRPSLIIADEAVSALDVSVQAQIINLMEDLQQEFQLTYIFIAHDLSVVKHICDRVAVMYAGKIVELSETKVLFKDPKHPYTRALLSAVPQPDPDVKMNFSLTGEVADPSNLPPGCSFNPRCPFSRGRCTQEIPELQEIEPGRWVSCHFIDELD